MTQENDSATGSGNTPDSAATPAKKTRAATKKATPVKPAAETTGAGAKASDAKPKKPAKSAAKPAAGSAVASEAEKKAPAKPRAAEKPKAASARKEKTASKQESTPAKKASTAKKPAVKAKTAPTKTVEKTAPQTKQAEAEPPAAVADKPEADKAAASAAAEVPAKEKQPRAPRAARSKTAAKHAAQPAENLTDRYSQPVYAVPEPSTAPAQPKAPQAVSQPVPQTAETDRQDTPQPDAIRAEATSGHAEGEAAHGDQASAKPASRRSRRGGRRRNKARTAASAAERENSMTAVPAPEADGAAEPVPARSAREDRAQDAQKARDANADTGQKDSPRKSGGKKDAAKQDRKQDAKPESEKEAPKGIPSNEPGAISNGKRKMFISVLSGELVEVVLAEEGQVVEYYVEMLHQAKIKGNIYKGVVSNIDANLQAAFISYAGGVKNGFLQIDEVHPEYYLAHYDPAKGRKYPPIQKVLKPDQEILVQVVKEPAGTKGAFLTSYLSLPGRFLVLTPGREQIGVSRKVDSDEERGRLRAMLEGLKPGPGLGVIVRTVSTGASKTSMQRDLQFLKRLWKDVRAKGQTAPAPSLIYEELDLSTRAVRDYLTEEVQEVWVDDGATAAQVTELATLLFPKKKDMVQVHHESGQSLFERFSLQKQLDQIHSREVSLPSGGSLVIDKTEALTAIDINSGRSSGKSNFEDMAYRTNMEAARAIPLQLRLRDIGGQIVADFIEMRDRDHWREVEKAVRNGMKGDRARYDVGKIGPFGMLEIVRQRLGSSAISISTEPCPCCKGTGIRRNMEWQAMQSLREIGKKLRQAGANNQPSLTYNAEPELAFYLLNAKRTILQNLESEFGVSLAIAPKAE